MPSDFYTPRSKPRTLADLIRELDGNGRSFRAPFATTPLAGPGRVRAQQQRTTKRASELDRRKRLAEEALRSLGRID